MEHICDHVFVRSDLYEILLESAYRPDPISGHGLLSYLLGYAYINMPHRFSERQMTTQPRGFTWQTKPWKTMERLAWRPGC